MSRRDIFIQSLRLPDWPSEVFRGIIRFGVYIVGTLNVLVQRMLFTSAGWSRVGSAQTTRRRKSLHDTGTLLYSPRAPSGVHFFARCI